MDTERGTDAGIPVGIPLPNPINETQLYIKTNTKRNCVQRKRGKIEESFFIYVKSIP